MRKSASHTNLTAITTCLALFWGCSVVAQTDSSSPDALARMDIDRISYILDGPATLPANDTNEIFIQQIGVGNQAYVSTSTQSSEVTIEQNGSNNKTVLDVDAKTYVGNLVQNGNANLFIENTSSPTLNLERNVGQDGNNHSVLIYGSNELTKNLRFNMQGSGKTIIIRNFK